VNHAPLCRIEAEVGAIESLGPTAMGERRVISIVGGRVLPVAGGPPISGRILPGGADWQWVRSDGITEISAHYVIEAPGGERIEVESDGYRHGPPEVMARLARGEPVAGTEYYFRTAVRFRASGHRPELTRLNGLIAIAVGERRARQVLLDVFEVC
jgi:hypothetical protein